MSEIINFRRKKTEILCNAVEQAEACLNKQQAELGWLKQKGALLAELVKASMRVDAAKLHYRERAAALAAHRIGEGVEPVRAAG
jgi:hypothetical protein